MATSKTSYIDDNGVKQTGYIKDSGIYSDFLKSATNDKNGIYSAMLQKNAEDVQSQMNRLNGQYEQLNTQLYRDYMQRKKNLPQQLAAQGISGGLSETSRLGLEASYQDGLNQNERARIDGIRDIQSAGDKAQLNILQNYWEDAAERANVMASIGDFSGYKALGYTDEQIAALKAAWDAKNAPRYYGGTPDNTRTYGAGYSTLNNSSLGIKASEWDYVYNNIATLLRSGNSAALNKYMNQVSSNMSKSQWEQTEALLDRYKK